MLHTWGEFAPKCYETLQICVAEQNSALKNPRVLRMSLGFDARQLILGGRLRSWLEKSVRCSPIACAALKTSIHSSPIHASCWNGGPAKQPDGVSQDLLVLGARCELLEGWLPGLLALLVDVCPLQLWVWYALSLRGAHRGHTT